MFETIIKVDGMACGMCEAHVNDAVRNAMRVKKVSSSHTKGRDGHHKRRRARQGRAERRHKRHRL